jgi:hypothetical protein
MDSKEWHGKPVVGLLACYSGSPEEGEKLLAPLKSFGKPVADNLIRRPYVQLQSFLDAANPKGRRYYWKSEYLKEITPENSRRSILNMPVKLLPPLQHLFFFR